MDTPKVWLVATRRKGYEYVLSYPAEGRAEWVAGKALARASQAPPDVADRIRAAVADGDHAGAIAAWNDWTLAHTGPGRDWTEAVGAAAPGLVRLGPCSPS